MSNQFSACLLVKSVNALNINSFKSDWLHGSFWTHKQNSAWLSLVYNQTQWYKWHQSCLLPRAWGIFIHINHPYLLLSVFSWKICCLISIPCYLFGLLCPKYIWWHKSLELIVVFGSFNYPFGKKCFQVRWRLCTDFYQKLQKKWSLVAQCWKNNLKWVILERNCWNWQIVDRFSMT